MNVVKYKLFFAWNYEKEVRWLNDLSRSGLQLVKAAFVRYEFDVDHTTCYEYQLEFLEEAADSQKSLEYIASLKDDNIEHVCSSNQWAYFRKEASQGQFELHSNLDAKIKHYHRMLTIVSVTGLNALILLFNSLITLFNIRAANIAISVVMGTGCLFALVSALMVYSRIKALRKEQHSHGASASST